MLRLTGDAKTLSSPSSDSRSAACVDAVDDHEFDFNVIEFYVKS